MPVVLGVSQFRFNIVFCLDLLSYLTGNADTSSSIDKSAPTEMGRPRPRNETQVNDVFTKNITSLFWFQIFAISKNVYG